MAIYFHKSLYERALKAIKESEELADVSRDLEKVSHQMEQVEYSNLISIGDPNGQQWLLQQACELDDALRKKYPMIDALLNAANMISKSPSSPAGSAKHYELDEYTHLRQDYYGILCHALMKKQITKTIEEFIEKVD